MLDRIDIFGAPNSRLLFDALTTPMRFAAKYNLIQAAGSDGCVPASERR